MPSTLPVLVVNDEIFVSVTALENLTVDSQGSMQISGPEMKLLLDYAEEQTFQLKRIATILAKMGGTDVSREDIPSSP